MALELTAPVDWEPLVALLPDQPPDAVQAVAFDELQFKVEEPPAATVVGVALIVTVGALAETATVTDCDVEPPVPVQVRVYVVDALIAPVDCEPLVDSLPVHPPEAEQAVAFVELQLSVELPPAVTLVGLALSVTVGGVEDTETVADCDAEPPVPVQLRVYVAAAVSAPVLWEPLVDLLPLHPPEAVHAVALVELQVRVEALPFATVLGLAER